VDGARDAVEVLLVRLGHDKLGVDRRLAQITKRGGFDHVADGVPPYGLVLGYTRSTVDLVDGE